MAVGRLFLTYPSRHASMRPVGNPYAHVAVASGAAIQFAASLPAVSNLLGEGAFPGELPAVVCGSAFVSCGTAAAIVRFVWGSGEETIRR